MFPYRFRATSLGNRMLNLSLDLSADTILLLFFLLADVSPFNRTLFRWDVYCVLCSVHCVHMIVLSAAG